jgi:hypothetical protein
MKSRQSKIVIAAVLMAALNTSGCQMLQGLLGGGGGGIMSMLGPLLGGGGAPALTELAQNDLFMTANDMAPVNVQWTVTPSKKEQRKDAALLYGSFGSR